MDKVQDTNFTVQEWFDKEDLSDDVELNCNEPILTSDHDTNSELSEANDSEGYTGLGQFINERILW
jgi:hypothetical protein